MSDEAVEDRDRNRSRLIHAGHKCCWEKAIGGRIGLFLRSTNVVCSEIYSLPDRSQIRIADNVELRLGVNYEVVGNPVSGNVPDDSESTSGLERETRLLYGAKWRLFEQCDWLPRRLLIILQGFTIQRRNTNTDLAARRTSLDGNRTTIGSGIQLSATDFGSFSEDHLTCGRHRRLSKYLSAKDGRYTPSISVWLRMAESLAARSISSAQAYTI
ncbi:MAG: hypothetical protein R3C56_21750 [Pirellulaceae bacterium]